MIRSLFDKDLLAKASRVRLLLMDCDGVLTDGRLYFSEDGEIIKAFHVRDGQGLVLWRNAGFASGIISGRRSRILKQRARELGINFLFQGVKDKVQVFEQILTRGNFLASEVAYIGDDVGDIDLIKRVGFSAAVADAVYDVKSLVDFVTRERGGFGAVREVIDFIFFAKKNEEESKT